MRQSLSENRSTYTHPPEPTTRNWPAAARAVLLAVVLSAVLVVVAIIDQTGGRSLADHVTAIYAPYGKRPDPSLMYGLVYTVAAIGALLWLLVLRVVQSRGRSAPILAVVVTTVTGALALLLLETSEYGTQILPGRSRMGYQSQRVLRAATRRTPSLRIRHCLLPPRGWYIAKS